MFITLNVYYVCELNSTILDLDLDEFCILDLISIKIRYKLSYRTSQFNGIFHRYTHKYGYNPEKGHGGTSEESTYEISMTTNKWFSIFSNYNPLALRCLRPKIPYTNLNSFTDF